MAAGHSSRDSAVRQDFSSPVAMVNPIQISSSDLGFEAHARLPTAQVRTACRTVLVTFALVRDADSYMPSVAAVCRGEQSGPSSSVDTACAIFVRYLQSKSLQRKAWRCLSPLAISRLRTCHSSAAPDGPMQSSQQ